ncbi:hypothetical protein ACOME3_006887 [Neoechinorhynchus agilis]
MVLTSQRWLPLAFFARTKLDFKVPYPRHDRMRMLEEITKPVIEMEVPDPIEGCLRFKTAEMKKSNLISKYDKVMANYIKDMFERNEMILICHELWVRPILEFNFRVILRAEDSCQFHISAACFQFFCNLHLLFKEA